MKLLNPLFIALMALVSSCSGGQNSNERFSLDMVHVNPGEGETNTIFNNPEYLKSFGNNGMVGMWSVNCAITYDNFEQEIVPTGSDEREWIERRAEWIDTKIAACDKAGIDVYAFTDVFVAPKSIWDKYGEQMGSENSSSHATLVGANVGNARNPSIQLEMVRRVLEAQVDGIFERFPSMDGLVTRFGETYLHDTPFHMGGHVIRRGERCIEDHIVLLNLLRELVCVKHGKRLIYRTWDFGGLHTRPEYYKAVTEVIEPHKNLVFSIKYTQGDFHRNRPFNATIGLGAHPQIIEVQCQREYEGKGAHPNYVARGAIEGFPEVANREGQLNTLQEFSTHPNFAGLWTWTRGGGWKGPYITNELWCELNYYVFTKWGLNPERNEEDIFNDYSYKVLKLNVDDAVRFRKIALLSESGVLHGRLSTVIAGFDPWWIRDQFMGGVDIPTSDGSGGNWGRLRQDFDKIIDAGLTQKAIEEKDTCIDIWCEIEALSKQINSGSEDFQDYIRVSSTYGRIKYDIIRQAWIVMLKGMEGERSGTYDKEAILSAKAKYDALWVEFTELKANNEQCATLYLPNSFTTKNERMYRDEGMDMAVNYYASMAGGE